MFTALPGENLPELLARRLERGLPGRAAHRAFEPELAYGRHQGPPRHDARAAAVMVLLYWYHTHWRLPLIVRPLHMAAHGGQVSLPGGAIEAGETCAAAALRELTEELGVPGSACRLLGKGTSLYVFASNFFVTPCLAVACQSLEFRPQASEVAEVIELPLMALGDRTLVGHHGVERSGMRFRAPHIAWNGRPIWGATCLVLAELAALLSDL